MIALVNQNQASSDGATTCSVEMNGCTLGNMLILAYAVRGDGNDPALTDGWIKLGGGNNASDPGDSDQRVYFAFKVVAAESEAVAIMQTATSRIYAVCSEYTGATKVKIRNDLSAIGSSNYTVTGAKSAAGDIMVYAITSAYYGSGRNQTVTPTDLKKVVGDSDAERLACWFDDGAGALSHTFTTCNLGETRDAVLECVQLYAYDRKYLLRSNSTLYTITDGALSALTETEITASLFRTYGVDEIPDGALLVGLTDPEVLYWHDSTDELPVLTSSVTGSPPVPQVVVTNPQDMSDSTILGIESVTVTASEDVLFALSFDDGATWKAYNGTAWVTLEQENSGMTADTFQNISLEAWAEVVTGTAYRVRFVLMDTTSYMTELVIHYLNEEG